MPAPPGVAMLITISVAVTIAILIVIAAVPILSTRRAAHAASPVVPPVRVHQVWISSNWARSQGTAALPPKYHPLVETWMQAYPQTHTLYDDQMCRELIEEHLPEYLQMYKHMPTNVEKADIARYAILYVHGGFYADLDTVLIKPVDVFVDCKNVHVAVEYIDKHQEYYVQYAFGCPQRHPAMIAVLQRIKENRLCISQRRNLHPDERVFLTTGPKAFSKALRGLDNVVVHRSPVFGAYKQWDQCKGVAHVRHFFDGCWKTQWPKQLSDWPVCLGA